MELSKVYSRQLNNSFPLGEVEMKEDKIKFIMFLIHLCCQYSTTIKSSRLRLKRLLEFVFYAMREVNFEILSSSSQ